MALLVSVAMHAGSKMVEAGPGRLGGKAKTGW